jgi:hypothetical protein
MGNSKFSVNVYNSTNEAVKIRLFDVNNTVFDVVLKAEESWSKEIPLDLCSISIVPLSEANQNTFSYTVHRNESNSSAVIIKRKFDKLVIVPSSSSDRKKECSSISTSESAKLTNFNENNGLVIFNETSKNVKICVTLGHAVKRNTHLILAPNEHNVIPTKAYSIKNIETHTLTLLKMDENDPNQVITKYSVDDKTRKKQRLLDFYKFIFDLKFIRVIDKEDHLMFEEDSLHWNLYYYIKYHTKDPTRDALFKKKYFPARDGWNNMEIIKRGENDYLIKEPDYLLRGACVTSEDDFWSNVGDDTRHLD